MNRRDFHRTLSASMAATFTVTLTASFAGAAHAQGFPSKPMTMVVPYPAGGPSDFVARQMQPELAKSLGQTLVVDNVGGVAGAIGVQKMLSAPADGHTFTLGSPLELIIAPLTLSAVKYTPDDIKMVAQIVKAPLVPLARKDFPANTVEELVALATRPGAKQFSMANVGMGSLFHLAAERLTQISGAKFVHVPYRGGAQIMTDLMGGQVDMGFGTFAGPIPGMVAEGKLKALGLTTRAPLARFANIPAIAANPKFAELEFDSWAGIQVPKNTPDEASARLNRAVHEALRNPDIRKAFEASGNTVSSPMNVADTDRLFKAEVVRYQAIAKSINLQPQ